MVNGLAFAFLVYHITTFTHSHTHSCSNGRGSLIRSDTYGWNTHQEQFGVLHMQPELEQPPRLISGHHAPPRSRQIVQHTEEIKQMRFFFFRLPIRGRHSGSSVLSGKHVPTQPNMKSDLNV